MEVEEIRTRCGCNCHHRPKIMCLNWVSKWVSTILLLLLTHPTYALFNYSPSAPTHNGNTWQWAVKLKTNPLNVSRDWLDGLANQIAEEHDLLNHGQVGELVGHYLFTRKPDEIETDLPETEIQLEQRLRRHPHVEYYSPQVLLNRQKRQFVPKGQYHLKVSFLECFPPFFFELFVTFFISFSVCLFVCLLFFFIFCFGFLLIFFFSYFYYGGISVKAKTKI